MKTRAIIIANVFACALTTSGCKPETKAAELIRPVLSTVVKPISLGNTILVGTVDARFKTDLGFRILERLIARPVNIGDSVTAGQIVAAADPADLQLAVRSAKAELAKSQASLTNARATEERKRTLITSGATTQAVLDAAVQERAAAEASVARALANLTKAIDQLGYAQLKADFAGVVTAVGAEVGQVVSPGQSVVTIARPDIREAVVDIGPDFPVPLKIGLPFTVSLQLLPAVQVQGRVREIAPQADSATRMRRVRIALVDPPPSFRLGSTVMARLAEGQTAILRVPASAVLDDGGKTFVWAVDLPASTVSLHRVEVLPDKGEFRVMSGLAEGTRVVTAGVHSLKQGQQVRIEQDTTP